MLKQLLNLLMGSASQGQQGQQEAPGQLDQRARQVLSPGQPGQPERKAQLDQRAQQVLSPDQPGQQDQLERRG